MLTWKEKINEGDKKNVQSLYDVFDKFITQNHKTQFSYDQKIRRQWESFKKVIQADPIDVEAQNKYVNLIKNAQSQKDNEYSKLANKMLRVENIAPILMQINRNKLQQVAKKTSKLITKNTKSMQL